MHPRFAAIMDAPAYFAARVMMQETFDRWPEIDRQFVRDFQTAGFNARTWELYLRAVLEDLGLMVDTVDQRPDFHCRVGQAEFFVEATTTNPSTPAAPPTTFEGYLQGLKSAAEDQDAIAIRLGSALYSKQQKRYHDLPHVIGKPLIFAIEPFHDEGALFHADGPLLRYLFGLDLVTRLAPGVAVPAEGAITEHSWDGKAIPAGWFSHEGNEHVSAVLYANSGTVPKFNRKGRQAGHRHERVGAMMRNGFELDPDPAALAPRQFFESEVGDVDEAWSEGVVLIHNPHALRPIDPAWFPDTTQVFRNGEDLAYVPARRHVFTQVTMIMQVAAD